MQNGQKYQGQHELQCKFLSRGQTLIFRLADFRAVIEKTDRTIAQCQNKHRERLHAAKRTNEQIGRNCHGGDADNKHKSAHCRRVLFSRVLRYIGQNFLSEIHFL